MENRLKCSRREFVANACAFGAVPSVLGMGDTVSRHLSIAGDERLTVLLSGVRLDGLAAALDDRGSALARRIASILSMRPLPRRCLVLPESSRVDVSRDAAALRRVFAESGVEAVIAERDVVHVVDAADCDIVLIDDTEGSLAPSVQGWLASELPLRTRPVFICAAHPPEWTCGGRTFTLTAMGRKFGDIIGEVPRLAGYMHGYGHRWQPTSERIGGGRGVDMLALPSAASWGDVGHVLLRTGSSAATAVLVQDGFRPRSEVAQGKVRADWRSMVAANRGATCTFAWDSI